MGNSRFPKPVRDAAVKCIPCNAPVARTVENKYVCVRCGESKLAAPSTWEVGE